MHFTKNEIATYLFCAQLPQTKTTPLTIIEWNVVVKSLSEQNFEPELLLTINSTDLIPVLNQAKESQKERIIEKISARQKLGISLVELEEIVHQGYGIMFRSQMPPRLKKLTQKFIPPFFYYAGDPSILKHRAMGVVGARDASDEELFQTTNIAKEAVSHGVVVISGGAKGVDTTAVEASLQNEGKAIVFPSDGLSKWTKKSSIRKYIANGKLLLMSSQSLNAPFSGAYAMQRNKFIHAPSDAVLVASSKISGKKKSGTWEGVVENLKYQWSPLYVIGNSEGVERLKEESNAKPFVSFEEIYKKKPSNGQTDFSNIEHQIVSLIESAIAKGIDKEEIERKFSKVSDLYYREKSEQEKLVVHEKQISMDEL